MARATRVVVICDMHREQVDAAGAFEFTVDGERHRLDLCPEHLAELHVALAPWIRASASSRDGTAAAHRNSPAAIRAWAAANGVKLPARGRIPRAVHEAYRAAH